MTSLLVLVGGLLLIAVVAVSAVVLDRRGVRIPAHPPTEPVLDWFGRVGLRAMATQADEPNGPTVALTGSIDRPQQTSRGADAQVTGAQRRSLSPPARRVTGQPVRTTVPAAPVSGPTTTRTAVVSPASGSPGPEIGRTTHRRPVPPSLLTPSPDPGPPVLVPSQRVTGIPATRVTGIDGDDPGERPAPDDGPAPAGVLLVVSLGGPIDARGPARSRGSDVADAETVVEGDHNRLVVTADHRIDRLVLDPSTFLRSLGRTSRRALAALARDPCDGAARAALLRDLRSTPERTDRVRTQMAPGVNGS